MTLGGARTTGGLAGGWNVEGVGGTGSGDRVISTESMVLVLSITGAGGLATTLGGIGEIAGAAVLAATNGAVGVSPTKATFPVIFLGSSLLPTAT